MISAREHLAEIADKLERDGVFEDDLPDLIAKIRQLSEYATTRRIPMDPHRSDNGFIRESDRTSLTLPKDLGLSASPGPYSVLPE